MTKKKEVLKNGNYQDLIEVLKNHNIITYKEKAIEHCDKLVPIAHQFIKDITSIIHPDDYKEVPNEFIEIVIGIQTYVAASLIVALGDMFPDLPINALSKNYKKSLDSSIDLQLRDHFVDTNK